MPIVRPRLTDYYGVLISQAQADFAIPFLDEDIPLYLDPFLLWRSPSQQDNALHTAIINAFNHLGYLEKQGKHQQALETWLDFDEYSTEYFPKEKLAEPRKLQRVEIWISSKWVKPRRSYSGIVRKSSRISSAVDSSSWTTSRATAYKSQRVR